MSRGTDLTIILTHLHRIEARLDSLLGMVQQVLQEENIMANALDNLEAEVSAIGDVEASAETLLAKIAQELKDALASNDLGRIQAAADKLTATRTALAKAVAANTPAAPAAP